MLPSLFCGLSPPSLAPPPSPPLPPLQATASVYLGASALLWLVTLLSWLHWHRTYRALSRFSLSSGPNSLSAKADKELRGDEYVSYQVFG